MAVKLCNLEPNLCVINYYARQENTTSPQVIQEHLSEVFGLAQRLTDEGNMVVICGDWNVSVGNLALHDNCPEVSRGGKVFNALLSTHEEFEILNPRHVGSMITHFDASGGRGKSLDLVLGNSLANDATTDLYIDEDKIVTPYRYIHRSDERRFTDHLTVAWEMNLVEIKGTNNKHY